MANSAKRDARRIEHAHKALEALQLRKAGYSYDKIAKALGFSDRSGAYYCVKDAIAAITAEAAEEVRSLELERLDELMLSHWDAAQTDPKVGEFVLKVMARRAKYLGLDIETAAPAQPQQAAPVINVIYPGGEPEKT